MCRRLARFQRHETEWRRKQHLFEDNIDSFEVQLARLQNGNDDLRRENEALAAQVNELKQRLRNGEKQFKGLLERRYGFLFSDLVDTLTQCCLQAC